MQVVRKKTSSFKRFWKQFFTWWHSQTLGTRLYTWRQGEYVGTDIYGNCYYRTSARRRKEEKRWVVYAGDIEGSKIPPGWFGWLRHTFIYAPPDEIYQPYPWEKPHCPNLTGTKLAYRPAGSQKKQGIRPPATGDYIPWLPPDL